MNGKQPDRVVWDEVDDDRSRREVIVRRADRSTYSAEFPADTDLGDVLREGEVVAFDAGDRASPSIAEQERGDDRG